MKNKNILIIVISVIVLIILMLMIILGKNLMSNRKSINIKLDTDNYLATTEVISKSNFILIINKDNKVSNIVFLNNESLNLSNKNIEGKTIEEAVKLIVDHLKNNDEFNDNSEFKLINYNNSSIYSNILEEFNKEFVIYGVDKNIKESSETLSSKITSLNLEVKDNELDNVETLYNYSKNLLEKNEK